ncbi:arylsulfotransferase family protein [Defluviimonas sp. WL0050]|uniref:Arylsulfotransferase family protein n=1 Tax=Albidovulum litorale TaxID=2984134 RepID=A0ABT2ZS52_9RHOB|nr:arylsulfotransferase family protein [Defluviimonas sp. WL0050]MCV2873980.1 arylsulfotransferase family protein [Defluviimonas sp. WL0050]
MERFLSRKIELRWLIAVIILMLLLSWAFGWMVFHRASGGQRFGPVAAAAVTIAKVPTTVKQILSGELLLDQHEVKAEFDEPFGFTFARTPANPQYVLVSRYNGDIGWSVVELYREGEGAPLHRWTFDDPQTFAFEGGNGFSKPPLEGDSSSLRTQHPVLMADGSIILNNHYGALYRVNACGTPYWVNAEFAFHHSTEMSPDGTIWTPGTAPTPVKGYGWGPNTFDDHIVQLNPDGEILYAKSVLEMLVDAGLENRAYDYDNAVLDPLHLNDIEPVTFDGEIAKRGDVLLSIGHLNMALLFRPSTDKVIWHSQDRIMHQHDVDMLAPDVISMYDNRRKTAERGAPIVLGTNELVRFELPGREAESFFREQMQSMDIRSFNQSLTDLIPGAGRMIEETSRARLIKFGEDGSLDWVFVNRSDNGKLWIMNWSRYIPKAQGDAALKALQAAGC